MLERRALLRGLFAATLVAAGTVLTGGVAHAAPGDHARPDPGPKGHQSKPAQHKPAPARPAPRPQKHEPRPQPKPKPRPKPAVRQHGKPDPEPGRRPR